MKVPPLLGEGSLLGHKLVMYPHVAECQGALWTLLWKYRVLQEASTCITQALPKNLTSSSQHFGALGFQQFVGWGEHKHADLLNDPEISPNLEFRKDYK